MADDLCGWRQCGTTAVEDRQAESPEPPVGEKTRVDLLQRQRTQENHGLAQNNNAPAVGEGVAGLRAFDVTGEKLIRADRLNRNSSKQCAIEVSWDKL